MIRGTSPSSPPWEFGGGRAVAADGELRQRFLREFGPVVQVLVPRGQAEDALAEHVGRQMADLAKLAGLEFAEHLAGLPCQAEPPVKPPRQQEAAFAADGAAPKSSMIFLLRFP